MSQVRRQAARVALANFLADVGWSGPWASRGDGHCAVYAEGWVYHLPFDQVMRARRWAARWIYQNLDDSVYQWSMLNRAVDWTTRSVRERRGGMRLTARRLVSKSLAPSSSVPRRSWLDAAALQALAVRRGQPLIVLEERLRPSATGFSRFFLPMVFFPDGQDVIYDYGDDTEGTVRGVLESYPGARMILATSIHYDHFTPCSPPPADDMSITDGASSSSPDASSNEFMGIYDDSEERSSDGGSATLAAEFHGMYLSDEEETWTTVGGEGGGGVQASEESASFIWWGDGNGFAEAFGEEPEEPEGGEFRGLKGVRRVAITGSTEWQGRGMPHIHILVWCQRPAMALRCSRSPATSTSTSRRGPTFITFSALASFVHSSSLLEQ